MTDDLPGPSSDHAMREVVDEAHRERLRAGIQAAFTATSHALEPDHDLDVKAFLRGQLSDRDADVYGDEALDELARKLGDGHLTLLDLPKHLRAGTDDEH